MIENQKKEFIIIYYYYFILFCENPSNQLIIIGYQ